MGLVGLRGEVNHQDNDISLLNSIVMSQNKKICDLERELRKNRRYLQCIINNTKYICKELDRIFELKK